MFLLLCLFLSSGGWRNITLRGISYTVGFRQSKTALFDYLFFDWILLVLLLIVSRVDIIVFAFFLEAVVRSEEVLPDGSRKSVGSSASRVLREQRVLALDEPSSHLVALGLAESRLRYVRGVALSREPPKLQQA